MKRLLCIVSSMDAGGAETFLMKIYRELDKTKYQLDFCVSKNKPGYFDKEIRELGGKMYYVVPKSKNLFKNFFSIKKIVSQNKYSYVLRTSQQSLAALDLLAAKLGGAHVLVYRSSNAGMSGSFLKKLINKIFHCLPNLIANVKLAPSTEAAAYVFGKKNVNKVCILHNALDYDLYKYDINKRNLIRQKLNLGNKLVIGHVGRFNAQKNHKFLLQIFKIVHEIEPNSCLLLIGKGELEIEIKENIKKLGIEDAVRILGVRKDVPELMLAMDIYLFPSFYEGMPNTIIEAQATGLKCILSNTITKEADITGNLTYVSLDKSAEEWANIVLSAANYQRKNYKKQFVESGYTINSSAEKFVQEIFKKVD